jgi:hypothetical protein
LLIAALSAITGSAAAQDVWQLAIEDLPPLDFPDSPGGEAKEGAAPPYRLPLPSPKQTKPEDAESSSAGSKSSASTSGGEEAEATQNKDSDTSAEGSEAWLAEESMYNESEEYQIGNFLAPVFSSGDWYRNGTWSVDATVAGIWRSSGKPKVLARDLSGINALNFDGTPIVEITTRHKGFRFEPGLGLTIGRFLGRDYFNRDASVEFGFLGLFDWQTDLLLASADENQLFTALNLNGPGGSKLQNLTNVPLGTTLIPGFDAVDVQEFEYSSDFNSFEFNVRLSHRPGRDRMVAMPDGTWSRQLASGGIPSFFAGLRYVRIEERLLWLSEEIHGGTNGKGSYDIQTHNALVGFQFGGNYKWVTKNWSAGAAGKVGAYVNFADSKRVVHGEGGALIPGTNVSPIGQDYQYATNLPGIQFTPPGGSPQSQASWDFTSRERASVISPFLETELFSQYNVNPNLSLRFAWNMFWINGLAMAPNQITFEAAEARINMGGNVFFTGLALSGEWVW